MVTRGSMDAERGEEEVLEFGLEMLRRSGGAYVVRTADDAFVSASTHNRTGSGESGKSQETVSYTSPSVNISVADSRMSTTVLS